VDHRGRGATPYSEAHVLAAWAGSNRSYVEGKLARETLTAGARSFLELPATLAFDLLYCLLLEESEENVDRRGQLDEQLASFTFPTVAGPADRSDRARRAATWGRTPAQQRAMRRAAEAGGRASKVGE
jgi:hypothetical protein